MNNNVFLFKDSTHLSQYDKDLIIFKYRDPIYLQHKLAIDYNVLPRTIRYIVGERIKYDIDRSIRYNRYLAAISNYRQFNCCRTI